MRWLIFVLLTGAAACGSSKRAADYCAKVDRLCGEGGECPDAAEVAEAERLFGKQSVDKYLTCVDRADSCAEITGCAVGLVGSGAEEVMQGVSGSPAH